MLVHRFGQTFDVLSTDERVTLRVGRASRLLAAEKQNCMRPTIGLLRHDTWLRGKRNQVRIHELLGRSMDHQLRGMFALNQVRHLRDPVMRLSLLASGIACVVVGRRRSSSSLARCSGGPSSFKVLRRPTWKSNKRCFVLGRNSRRDFIERGEPTSARVPLVQSARLQVPNLGKCRKSGASTSRSP